MGPECNQVSLKEGGRKRFDYRKEVGDVITEARDWSDVKKGL